MIMQIFALVFALVFHGIAGPALAQDDELQELVEEMQDSQKKILRSQFDMLPT